MICCTPSGFIILSLRNLKFHEGRGPWAGYEGRGQGVGGRITQRPIIVTSEHIMHLFLVSLFFNLNWRLYARRKDPNLRKYEP